MGTEIFLISTSLFTGGAERQAIWLANALSKSGYKVNLLILKKGDAIVLIHGIHAITVLEDMQCISVKQGPFLGADFDKVNVKVKK